MPTSRGLHRNDSRIIIHFDYDCFYASVVEHETPALKSLPLAIQQKQIVVTCNYEARKRGLRKLQLITEAKKLCPEAVIILGEDLTRFRHASKELYGFLRDAVWSDRVERLGFDEVWLDCTDMIDYNMELINHRHPSHSFFHLDKGDPIRGFEYDSSTLSGRAYPDGTTPVVLSADTMDSLLQRLVLGSHLAKHLRHQLDEQKGYTATVGIATNKILSKLVGNVNKPRNQTTLLPPYDPYSHLESNVTIFMDAHDIGRVPGIGFKLAQKIRARILGRPPDFHEGLVYGTTKESVSVHAVRLFPNIGPEMLDEMLSGPGAPKEIGSKIWALINGIDDSEVGLAKRVPSQISQEDSYMKYLHTFDDVRKQLLLLSERLIRRMHLDLMEDDDDNDNDNDDIDRLTSDHENRSRRRWLAHPRTLRLTTRPRPPRDDKHQRTFQRISRSTSMPSFTSSLTEAPALLAERLVNEALTPLFRRLHPPEQQGWNVSLINVACTNMAETADEKGGSAGRDIGRMFRRQDDVLREFTVYDEEREEEEERGGSGVDDELWASDDEPNKDTDRCAVCGSAVPAFAAEAHARFHEME